MELLNVLIRLGCDVAVAAVAAMWTAKQCFRKIDRYVEETTTALRDAAGRLGLTVGEADGDESLAKRG